MLPSKNNRAAGELEGARPASSWIIAIKNVRQDFLTSKARFFVKRKLHKKCGVFEACKKAIGFFDTLRKAPDPGRELFCAKTRQSKSIPFDWRPNLKTIVIPSSVNRIENNLFPLCYRLTDIYYLIAFHISISG